MTKKVVIIFLALASLISMDAQNEVIGSCVKKDGMTSVMHQQTISKEMKYIRINAMAVTTMGIIHIAATFTPLINGCLEVIYGALSVDGLSAVAFMPHNPFAWLVLILVGSLVIHATYIFSAASRHHIKSR